MLQIIENRIDPSRLSNSSFSQYQNIYVLFSLHFAWDYLEQIIRNKIYQNSHGNKVDNQTW